MVWVENPEQEVQVEGWLMRYSPEGFRAIAYIEGFFIPSGRRSPGDLPPRETVGRDRFGMEIGAAWQIKILKWLSVT